jgi:hypothetical protein
LCGRSRPVILARDSPSKPSNEDGVSLAGKQPETLGNGPKDSCCLTQLQHVCDSLRAEVRIVYYQATVHDERDTHRRTPFGSPVRFERKVE